MARKKLSRFVRENKDAIKAGSIREITSGSIGTEEDDVKLYSEIRDDGRTRYFAVHEAVSYRFDNQDDARKAVLFMKAVRDARNILDWLDEAEHAILMGSGKEVEHRTAAINQAAEAMQKAFKDVWEDMMEGAYADMMED